MSVDIKDAHWVCGFHAGIWHVAVGRSGHFTSTLCGSWGNYWPRPVKYRRAVYLGMRRKCRKCVAGLATAKLAKPKKVPKRRA